MGLLGLVVGWLGGTCWFGLTGAWFVGWLVVVLSCVLLRLLVDACLCCAACLCRFPHTLAGLVGGCDVVGGGAGVGCD